MRAQSSNSKVYLHGKRADLYIIITDLHLSILTNPPDSICLFVCLSTYLIIYACVYMSVRWFIRPSVGLCLHMCTPWRLEKELGGGCGCVAVCLHVRLSICMTGWNDDEEGRGLMEVIKRNEEVYCAMKE